MKRKTQTLLILLLCAVGTTFARQVPIDTTKKLLNSENYINRFGDLNNTLYRIKTEKSANVVFFGGSITHNPGWRDKVGQYLQESFPDTKFSLLNAGIPSLGSLPHAFRVNQDVLSKGRVDLMFLETAVNDRGNGTNEQTQRRALEGIIRHVLKTNPYANIIMMAFVDPDKIKDYNSGKIPPEVQIHEDLAKMYHLPLINLAKEVTDRINAGEFTWEKDFKNLHPSPFGQAIYFRSMKQLFSVELAKPSPAKLIPSYLPKQADALAYTHGNYLAVGKATNLNGFTLDPNWKPADSVHTRPGFVNVPVLVGEKPGASLELTFTGQTIGFAIMSGPDAGIVKYSVDGKNYPDLELYTQWSKSLHLPWYLLLGDGLVPGKHLLKLGISGNKNEKSKGTACRIVYFLVNGEQ
jgi:sialidase-1